jgi:hypothetical protein
MIVPVRAVLLVLGATLKLAVPFPVPPPDPVNVIQLTLLYELQPHPANVVTVTDAVPPVAGTDCVLGLTANVHGAAAA